MVWGEVGTVANVVLLVAYLAIAQSILWPLATTGQLYKNRLGCMTGLIFFSCGIGHAIHVDHAVRGALHGGWSSAGIDWHLATWDGFTAVVAIAYWNLRRVSEPMTDQAVMFEDLQRRQRELEQEAAAALLREELAVERELVARQAFAQAFESAPNGMALADQDGRLLRANRAFTRVVDRPADALVGLPMADLVQDDQAPTVQWVLGQRSGDAVELTLPRTDGRSAWVRVAATSLRSEDAATLVQLEDVTERRQAQERLNHLALHDPLTGLPNRVLFHDRSSAALRNARRTGTYTACLFIDLDHFKVVNDSLGHMAGDQVLQDLAGRLVDMLRPGDTVARMGGDEFCLLLERLEDPDEAEIVAARVLDVLEGYVLVDGMEVTTGASVGVAVAGPADGATSQTLVRDADTALYRAKGRARGTHVVFDDTIRDEAQRRLRIEAELRRAIADQQISVAYQPQWSLSGRRVVGVEALVRWEHPERGQLDPPEFIGVAIESGLVVELGQVVLEQAVADLARWLPDHPDLKLAVNLSSRQLARPTFVADVAALLAAHGIPAELLCLELTETDLTALGRSALATLDHLRSLGIKLAVDDVGTGQSSLTHLVTLPVDVIKIDQTFVDQVHLPGAKRAVVEALLSLARTIGVDVVAEGAESVEQAEVLRDLGGDVIQGFVVSQPLDATAFARLVADLQTGEGRVLGRSAQP
jgi:diguanylate cyclase (GGDEF)-like protein/PAS domain S-box-containing protein